MINNRKIRILVAEDDYLVSKLIDRAINTIGHEIIGIAPNGEKAIEMVKALKPDIVLMDIQMPRMNGLDAARIIQDTCPTPIITLTAHESQELVQKAGEMGVSAYLTKPPRAREIERAITIALARHNDIMELRKLNKELEYKNYELAKALKEIKSLRGIIPICANCKKIRDDEGFWKQVEEYIQAHSDAVFSHSICPDCRHELYPNLFGSEVIEADNK